MYAGNSMAAVYLPKLGVWFCFFAGSTMQLLALLGYTIWPIWCVFYVTTTQGRFLSRFSRLVFHVFHVGETFKTVFKRCAMF
jgi:hypothetical protein